jgi:hypothetical protein
VWGEDVAWVTQLKLNGNSLYSNIQTARGGESVGMEVSLDIRFN